ncbi:hypothetical protein E4U52_007581 [Claviceps spartinae]|nr:hypothetical protein E4U52_007581 [Claviceps spartinae]
MSYQEVHGFNFVRQIRTISIIKVRVGLSFISMDKACRNAEQEIPDFDFDKDYTSRILPTRQNRKVIHALTPTDENSLWDSEEPYFDSYYWIWGSFRSTHPLITLVDLDSQALMVHSLIDIFRHEGKAASSRTVECLYARVSQYHSGRHCGSKADNLLADSYVKGLQSNIDWETAYTAVISDADDEPSICTIGGRGGLHSWKTRGYIPTNYFDPFGVGLFTRLISRTIEYLYNDFCIAEMAKMMNKTSDAEKYLERSRNWKNIPNVGDLVDSGFQGFLQPRYLNGTFGWEDAGLKSSELVFGDCFEESSEEEDEVDAEIVDREEY